MRGETAWITRAFVFASIGAASAAVLAALCGWVIGRFAAARAAAKGVEGAWMLVTGIFALVVGLASFLMSLGNPYLMLRSSTWLLGLVVLFLVAGVIARVFRSSGSPDTRRERPAGHCSAGWRLSAWDSSQAIAATDLAGHRDAQRDRPSSRWCSAKRPRFPIGMFPDLAPRARR
jgi:hypothetical protein